MNEIIKINTDTDKPSVSGRELHKALEEESYTRHLKLKHVTMIGSQECANTDFSREKTFTQI